MKKIFSFLFVIAILFSLMSFFSQKSLASVTEGQGCDSTQDGNWNCISSSQTAQCHAAGTDSSGKTTYKWHAGQTCSSSTVCQPTTYGNSPCVSQSSQTAPAIPDCVTNGGTCVYTSCSNSGLQNKDGYSCGSNINLVCCKTGGGGTTTTNPCTGTKWLGGVCASDGKTLYNCNGSGGGTVSQVCSGTCETHNNAVDSCSSGDVTTPDCAAKGGVCVYGSCGTGTTIYGLGGSNCAQISASYSCCSCPTNTSGNPTCPAGTVKTQAGGGAPTGCYYCKVNTSSVCNSTNGGTCVYQGCTNSSLTTKTGNFYCTSSDSVNSGGIKSDMQCCNVAPGSGPTCTPSTGPCTSPDICSTTGSRNVTTCANDVATTTQQSCTLTPPASCNKPTVPVLTCTTATPTTVDLSWTSGANTTETVLYYCDVTKANVHNPAVKCTKDSQATTDGSQAGWYFVTGNSNSTSPRTITGLTAGHAYTAFIRAYNGSHITSTSFTDSADTSFTGGSCNAEPGLALVLGLDGIGHTGDQVNADWTTKTNTAVINGQSVTNPVAGSNQSPKTPTRQVTLTLTNTTDNTSVTLTGNVTYVPSGTNVGKYAGTVPYGANFKTGTYTIKIAVDGHLIKLVPGSVTVTGTNTTVNVPGVNLVAGNITTPNALAILDYNILLSCISDSDYKDLDAHALCNQNANYKIRADLEDNGAIDKFDYNLFLREFSKVQAGD